MNMSASSSTTTLSDTDYASDDSESTDVMGIDIESMQHTARSQGLPSDHMMIVIDAIESAKFSTEAKLKLMKCLIPQNSLSEEIFIRMTSMLWNSNYCVELKVEILRWMITVHYFMDPDLLEKLSLLYELFLELLHDEILRPYVCHFLYLITVKNDVSSRRINFLHKRLIGEYGLQPCLHLLLITYYKLCPERFDEEIEESLEYNFEILGVYPNLIKGVHPSYVPSISSVRITTQEADNTETLSKIFVSDEASSNSSYESHPFHEIFQELDALKKTNNVKTILKSKYRRLFLTSDIPLKTKVKVYDYIMTSLYENFTSSAFLQTILEIFHEMQKSFAGVSDFTDMLVSSWDGQSNLDIIISLLKYEPMYCFEKIGYKMDLIREKLLNASVPIKCELLYCFSKIYEHWVLTEKDRYSQVLCDGKCSTSEDSSEINFHSTICQINKLGAYIDSLCDALLLDESHSCLLNEVLLHYERVSIAHMKVDEVVLHLPTNSVFLSSLFTRNSITLENFGRLMLRWNAEITSMHAKRNPEAELASYIFRVYTQDIYKILRDKYCIENNKDSTKLFETKILKRIKIQCPNFENQLVLHKHPALLKKKATFLRKYRIPKSDRIFAAKMPDFLNFLAVNNLENFCKLITVLDSDVKKN